jgi:hypothetical protein
MRTLRVRFDITVPDEVTDDEAREWVEFSLYQTGISTNNPLVNKPFEAVRSSVNIYSRVNTL